MNFLKKYENIRKFLDVRGNVIALVAAIALLAITGGMAAAAGRDGLGGVTAHASAEETSNIAEQEAPKEEIDEGGPVEDASVDAAETAQDADVSTQPINALGERTNELINAIPTPTPVPILEEPETELVNNPVNAIYGKKIVLLTFDDGPGQYTEQILDILDKYRVKATFFVTNNYEEYESLLGEEAERGHSVCVHTLHHDYDEVYSSEEAFWADFDAMNDLIEQYTGERSRVFRFPGGSSNTISSFNEGIMSRLVNEAAEKGYDYYDWNVTSGDAGDTEDPDEIVENVLWGIEQEDISIVLCHDIHPWTLEALEPIIVGALEKGYTFLPIHYGITECHHPVNN